MALDFNGSTDALTKASSEITAYPCTIAAWFNSDSVAANQLVAGVWSGGTNHLFSLSITTASKVRAQARAGGTTVNADSTGTFSTGTWVHGVAVQTDSTHHLAYINGSAGSNVATSVSPTGMVRTEIGSGSVGANNAFDGRIAEVGIWNVALTAAEIASLSSGFSPLLIRPSALVFYAPLITSGVINLMSVASPGVQSMTATGTAPSAHPRILNPNRRSLRRFDVTPPSTTGAGTADGAATVAGIGAAVLSSVGTVSSSAYVTGFSNASNQFDLITSTGNYTVPAGFNPLENRIHVFTCGGNGSHGSTTNSGTGGTGGGGPGYARLDNVAWSPGDVVNLTIPAHGTASPTIVRNAAAAVLASISGAENGTYSDNVNTGVVIPGALGGAQFASSSGYSVLFPGGTSGDAGRGHASGGGGASTPQGSGHVSGTLNQFGAGHGGSGGGAVGGRLSTDGGNGQGGPGHDNGLGGTGPTGTAGGTTTSDGNVDGGDGSNGSGGSGGFDDIHITPFTFPDDASGGGDGGYYTLWTISSTPVRVRAGAGGGAGHQNTDNGAQFGGDGGDGGGGGGGGGAGYNAGGVTPAAGIGGIGTDSFIVVEWVAASAAPSAADDVTFLPRRPSPPVQAYPPKKFYLPPHEKKPSVTQVKRLYQAARKKIPEAEQRDLIPVEVRKVGTSTATLPQAQFIDFEKLRADFSALRAIMEALRQVETEQAESAERERIETAEARKQKRQRDEEALMNFLMSIE